jgi:hypothetical protein
MSNDKRSGFFAFLQHQDKSCEVVFHHNKDSFHTLLVSKLSPGTTVLDVVQGDEKPNLDPVQVPQAPTTA